MEKDKKLFVFIGIPSFLFVGYVFLSFYVLFIAFYLTLLIILLLALLKKDRIYFRATKIGVIMVLAFFINNYNLIHLPGQLVRHSPGGRQQLLNPEHAKLVDVRSNFSSWHVATYNVSFDSVSETTRDELEIKVKRVDYYVRRVLMEYTSDTEAPYHASDHVATLDEIFASDTDGNGKLQDDCDGISVMTASFLLSMGYKAYVAECLSHWNTIVFPNSSNPKTLEGFTQGIHLYNSWGRPSYYIFNQTEVIFPPGRPISLSLTELFFEPGEFEDFAYIYQYNEFDLPFPVLLLLTYGILLIASLLVYLVVRVGLPKLPLKRKEKIKFMLKNAFKMSLVGSFSAFVIYWLAISGFGFLGTLILAGTVIFMSRYMEYQINSKKKELSGR